MVQSVAGHLLRPLSQRGVTEIFGYPGDSVNGLVAQMGEIEGGPRSVRSARGDVRLRGRTLKAFLSGDPDRMGVASRGRATKIQEFLPHRR